MLSQQSPVLSNSYFIYQHALFSLKIIASIFFLNWRTCYSIVLYSCKKKLILTNISNFNPPWLVARSEPPSWVSLLILLPFLISLQSGISCFLNSICSFFLFMTSVFRNVFFSSLQENGSMKVRFLRLYLKVSVLALSFDL